MRHLWFGNPHLVFFIQYKGFPKLAMIKMTLAIEIVQVFLPIRILKFTAILGLVVSFVFLFQLALLLTCIFNTEKECVN